MGRVLAVTVVCALFTAVVFWQVRGSPAEVPPDATPGAVSTAEPAVVADEGSTARERGEPALPRVYLDTAEVPPSGRVIRVTPGGRLEVALKTVFHALGIAAGGRLQAALNMAQLGDVIELDPGETFAGNFVLHDKKGDGWITIRSSAYEQLPAAGSRVSPSDAVFMPKIISPNSSPAIRAAPGAHHYRFIGIEVTTTSQINFGLIHLESPRQISLDQVPSDVIVDRCFIHGTATGDIRRGIVLNGARLAVIDSYLSDFHSTAAEAQAIVGWNGPGPFAIVGNYLEGAGENVMFGGQDPRIHGLVPADIEIRGNHFFKPLTWQEGDSSYAGIPWVVKNLFELKNARRVLVKGNVFEQTWSMGAYRWAIMFTPRNDGGGTPWAVVEDVTFTNNIVRRATGGIQILGRDYRRQSQQAKRILIRDNLFVDIGVFPYSEKYWTGTLLWMEDGAADVTFDHNTSLQTGRPLVASARPGRRTATGFVFTNNVLFHNQGVSGVGTPRETLNTLFLGAVFTGNVLIGGDPTLYPPGNVFPATFDLAHIIAFGRGDVGGEPVNAIGRAGIDGPSAGANLAAIAGALPPWWWDR